MQHDITDALASHPDAKVLDKSGFERFVALAARRHNFLYGLAAMLISLALGWAAAAVFRRSF